VAQSPIHDNFDSFPVPRIQAGHEETGKWFGHVEDNSGLIYVSEGDPNTTSAPESSDHPYSRVDS
jgi:hypothetical protein